MAYALGSPYRLTTEDERHLWSRYIHLSAHCTPSKGLLISKPRCSVTGPPGRVQMTFHILSKFTQLTESVS